MATCPNCNAEVTEAVRAADSGAVLLDAPSLTGTLQSSTCCDEHPLIVREEPNLVGIVPLYSEHGCG